MSRNPFLFRGPIPTVHGQTGEVCFPKVAIPSYSEVLFLHCGARWNVIWKFESQSLLIQRSYSYKRTNRKVLVETWSQSLLIQRSYSYADFHNKINAWLMVAIPSYSEVLFLPRYMLCKEITLRCRNPFLFRGPIPTKKELCYEKSEKQVAIPSYSEVLFLLRAFITPLFST